MTTIEKYGNRNWAVWFDGPDGKELVAVTVYKKGAVAVLSILDALIKSKRVA